MTQPISIAPLDTALISIVYPNTRRLNKKCVVDFINTSIFQAAPTAPAHLREEVGRLKVKSDDGFMKQIAGMNNRLFNRAALYTAPPSLLLTFLVGFGLVADKPHPFSGLAGFALVITGLMTFALVWLFASMVLSPDAVFDQIENIKKSGWDAKMFQACDRMVKLGMGLPAPLLALMPSLHKGTSSMATITLLGDDDAIAMFGLADMLDKIAGDAEKTIALSQPLPLLTLRGANSELLYRVGSALGINEAECSKVNILV